MHGSSVLVLLAAIGVAAPAGADDTSARADALFHAGRSAADRGDWATACRKFRESREVQPAPGTLLNLADCEEQRGQLLRAWRDFREVAEALPSGDVRKQVARARAERVADRIPKLRVRLSPASAPALVRRDGVELGSSELGRALPVDPGVHRVVVSARGFRDRTYTVRLARGEERDVQVARGAARGDAARTAALAFGAVGLASLATSTATGVLALTDLSASGPDAGARWGEARSFAAATVVSLGVGVTLVAVSLVLLLTSHHRIGDHGALVTF